MSDIFAKLNLKQPREILVLNAPASFLPELAGLADAAVQTELAEATIEFALVFVTTREELERIAPAIISRATGDAVLWFAYPKKSSKRYQSDLSRDAGWQPLGNAGYECVRMVAIDADWSAARFRHVDFIRSLQRDPRRRLSSRPQGPPNS